MNQQLLAEQLTALMAKLTTQSQQLMEQARAINDLAAMKRFLANWLAPMTVSMVEAQNAFVPLLSLAYATAEDASRVAEEARLYADLNELREVVSFLVPAVTLLSNLDLPPAARQVANHMANLVSYLTDTYPLDDDMVAHLTASQEPVVEPEPVQP